MAWNKGNKETNIECNGHYIYTRRKTLRIKRANNVKIPEPLIHIESRKVNQEHAHRPKIHQHTHTFYIVYNITPTPNLFGSVADFFLIFHVMQKRFPHNEFSFALDFSYSNFFFIISCSLLRYFVFFLFRKVVYNTFSSICYSYHFPEEKKRHTHQINTRKYPQTFGLPIEKLLQCVIVRSVVCLFLFSLIFLFVTIFCWRQTKGKIHFELNQQNEMKWNNFCRI